MIRFYRFYYVTVFFALFFATDLLAQSCTCGAVTTYTVDLTSNPNSTYTVSTTRSGLCCGASAPDRCIKFIIYAHPQATEIGFDVSNPSPPGGAFYQVDCGVPTSLGSPLCLSGVDTFCLTYCKAGGDSPTYTISSSRGFGAGSDITIRNGCTGYINVNGLNEPSITWTPLTYLSCTSACDTTYVTPTSTTPAFINYIACGTRAGCASGNYCDTVRVNVVSALTVSIAATNTVVCVPGPNVTLTATPTGGNSPYTYSWSTGATTPSIVAGAGTYTVSVNDNTTGCAAITQTITIGSQAVPADPVASSDSPVCSGNTLNLTASSTGTTYSWSGPNSFTSTLQNPSIAGVTTAATGTYSVTATTNGCTGPAGTTSVIINTSPTTAAAGPDQTGASTCGLTSVTLAANSPVVGSGSWSIISGAGGSFVLATNPTTVFNGTAGTTYVLRWTITNPPCPASTDDVTITFNQNPITATAGPDQTSSATCGVTSVTLAGNTPTIGTGNWSIISGAGGSFVLATNPTTVFNGVAGTTYVLRWTISNGPCADSFDEVTITFNQNPTTAAAGPDQNGFSTCGLTSVTLAGNTPAIGTGNWSIISGAGGSFVLATNPTTVFNGTAGTTYVLRWTITNAPCTSTDDVTITFNQNPTTAAAGADQASSATCGLTSVTLAGNTPTVGTGSWSIVSGAGGSFVLATNPTTVFNGTAGTTYVLRWTITNAPCTASADDVTITFNQNPTTASAGADQTSSATCGSTSVTLAGNTPTVGTGSWSIISGAGGSFVLATNPTTVFNGVAGTTYVLRWIISNAPCTASFDEVTITFNQNPTTAAAGADQTSSATCGLTSVTLAGNTPTIGTGSWSIISGVGGSFVLASNPTTVFNGTAGTTYVLRWTISNAPCTASFDEVTITFNQNPTAAAAGADQTSSATCGLTSVTLAGNTPTVGTGSWSITSGAGGSFVLATNPTTVFNGVAGTTYVLRWTISNAPCSASTDDVTISFNQVPTTAAAGADQTSSATCGLTSVTLAGNTPTVGTGNWSIISGAGGSFVLATNPTTVFNGVAGTTYVLRWTITNAPCTSADDVTITFNQNPTTAAAGADQTSSATCGLTSVTLAGNIPTVGAGNWSIISGAGGSFVLATNPTTVFNGVAGTTYVLRWTISNAPCTASFDEVTIIFNQNPAAAAAGADQTSSATCGLTSVTLAANIPAVGTGSWSITSGAGGSFVLATNPSTVFNGTTGTTYVLRWTISNAPCADSFDEVTITFNQNPTTAAAGADQTSSATCGLTSVTLAGNTPTVGTGSWSIISGAGGSFVLATNPTTVFNGTAGITYVLRWTITNAPCTSADDVTITFNVNPTVAAAGADQPICSSNATLAGNIPTVGTGSWTRISGSGTLTTPTSATSGITGLLPGTSTFRWTISNGPCTSFDEVDIINGAVPVVNAGTDQLICASTTSLLGNTPAAGTGSWTKVSGSGSITSPTVATSGLTALTPGTSTFQWTITDGGCVASDVVDIIISDVPTTAAAGGDQTSSATCGLTSVTLGANPPTVGTGSWSITSGAGGSFALATNPATVFSGTAGTTYVLRWTISNAPCADSFDEVTITFNQSPTTAAAGADQINSTTCGLTSVTLGANIPTVGTGSWSIISGAGGSFVLATNPTTVFNGIAGTTYVLRWTITNAPCTSSDDVTITFNQNPTTATAGSDQTSSATCGLTAVTLGANIPTVGTGSWSIISGAGGSFVLATDPATVFNGTAGTTYVLRWTITNAPCTASFDEVTITFNQNPTAATAGADQISSATCGLTSVTLAGNVPTVGTGTWSIISGAGGSFVLASNPTTVFNGTAGITYVLRWTISNAPCTDSFDEVTITFNQNPTAATAGPDQTNFATCGITSVTLGANTPTVGTGSWSIISGAGGSFALATDPATVFSGTAGTTYVLRWTITNAPCTDSFDEVTITFNQNPTAATAGADQISSATCGLTSVTLAGNAPTVGAGTWSIISGAGGSFALTTDPTTVFNGVAGTTYVLRWTISNAPCTASADDVNITFNQNPTTATAGADQTSSATCGLTSLILAGNAPTVGTGTWSIISGAGGSFVLATNPTTVFNGTAGTTYVLRWTISNAPCTDSFDEVTITFNQNPTTATAGPDQNGFSTCGLTSVTLAGNTPAIGTGSWSIISGAGGSFVLATDPTTVFNGTAGTTYVLRWTITNAPCTSADDVTITFNQNPTAAAAGADQTGSATCGLTSVTLAGNTPTVGTGNWSIISGTGGSFTLATDPATVFNGIAGTTYVLRWTISNSPCTASFDDVTIIFNQNPTAATAGADQTSSATCGLTSVTLAGNIPSIGTGSWSIISGAGGSFTLATNPTTLFSGTTGTTYVLRWTISNAPCTDSYDEVTVTFNQNPTTAAAGPDQVPSATCGLTSVTLAGNTPTIGTGNWSIISGTGGSFVLATDPATVFSGTAGTTYVLRWTITNAPCTSSDDVTITFNTIPAAPTAGSDSPVCVGNTLSLTASGVAGATYSWSGPNGFTSSLQNPTLAGITLTDAGTFSVTVTVGGCTGPAGTTLVVVNAIPAAPTAGNNGPVCSGQTLNLTATPVAGATYSWSGPNGFTSASQNPSFVPTTTAASGTYTVIAIVSGCPGAGGTTSVTVNQGVAAPTAGSNSPVCEGSTLSLTSNTVAGATYSWNGPNGFTSSLEDPSIASVTTAATGTYSIMITSAVGCISPVSVISVIITPTISVNAGPNQTVCANNAATSLSGLIAGGTTTGIWSSSGTGTFTPAATSTNATYNPSAADTAAGTVKLILTTTNNGGCAAKKDSLVVTITDAPAVNAGTDQLIYICGYTDTINLSGKVSGGATTGKWKSLGTGYFFPNDSLLTASYKMSQADSTAGTVTVLLTSTNNGNCNPVTDTMKIRIVLPAFANAGPDTSMCGIQMTMYGIITGGLGTGYWQTIPPKDGFFFPDSSALNATFAPIPGDTIATLVLTSSNNGPCPVSRDTMIVKIQPGPAANAGPDLFICKNNLVVNLNGSVLFTTKGQWNTMGGGSFSPSVDSLNTTYIPASADTTAGSVKLTLTTKGKPQCVADEDTMEVFFTPPPSVNAGPDLLVCYGDTSAQLSGAVSAGATTGKWSTLGDGTFFPNDSLLTASYILGPADTTAGTITIILTSTNNGNCFAKTDTVKCNITPLPVVNAGTDLTVCANKATVVLGGSVTVGATAGFWTSSGSGTFSPDSAAMNASYIPSLTDTTAGFVYLKLTSLGGCRNISDSLLLTITDAPFVNAGPNAVVCEGNLVTTLNGIVSGGTITGQWSTTGSGTFNPNNTTLNATYSLSPADSAAGSVWLILTSTNNGTCSTVKDSISVSVVKQPLANAGNNQTICPNDTALLNGSITFGSGTGIWSTPNGTGAFVPSVTTLNAKYVPSAADTAAKTVTLVLTTTNYGNCFVSRDTMVLNFIPAPSVNAGSDQTVCANNATVLLNGNVSGTSTTGIWSSTGNGTFTPNDTTLIASYNPDPVDIVNGQVKLVLTSTNYCFPVRDTLTVIITPAPSVNAGNDIAACNSTPIVLNGSVTGGSTTGKWSTAGNGTFIPNDSVLNPFYNPGASDYTNGSVTLYFTSTGNGNCKAEKDSLRVTFAPSPVAGFSAGKFCSGQNSVLTDSSTVSSGTITAWSWLLGNGNTSTLQNPTTSYSPAGSYTVTLIATSSLGCTDTARQSIYVNPVPTASFSAFSDCKKDSVFFTDNSTINPGTITGWNWNFGDAGTSALQNPAHNYATGGTYIVSLIVVSDSGCTAGFTKTVSINAPPVANFTTSNGCLGSTINFTDNSNTPIGVISNWNWYFGDGNTSTQQSPSYTYTVAGTYTVSLKITTDQGCIDSITKVIIIDARPIVNFNGDTLSGCRPFAVFFTDSSIAPGGSAYKWYFGDNDSSFVKNATHMYTTSGTYSVKLIVTTPNGCIDSLVKTNYIRVSDFPTALFTFTPDTVRLPNTLVMFTSSSSGDSTWLWNFGDGSASTLQNPVHTYSVPGTYAVCLTVTNSTGCPNTYCDTVFVKESDITPVGIPNAFTPNGDLKNDVLLVRGGPVLDMELRIYNEWGNEIFYSATQSLGWDGTYKNKAQPEGVYVYTLKGRTPDNQVINKHGIVSLIR